MRTDKSRKRDRDDDKAEGKIQKTVGEDVWRAELDATCVNDDRWWCIATMLAETRPEHGRHVSLLNEVVASGKRTDRRVLYLSRRQTTDTVKTLSEEDPEKCPVAQRICHYANALLSENNGALSAWLMARVVKYLIYRAKIEPVDGSARETTDPSGPGIDGKSGDAGCAIRANDTRFLPHFSRFSSLPAEK